MSHTLLMQHSLQTTNERDIKQELTNVNPMKHFFFPCVNQVVFVGCNASWMNIKEMAVVLYEHLHTLLNEGKQMKKSIEQI